MSKRKEDSDLSKILVKKAKPDVVKQSSRPTLSKSGSDDKVSKPKDKAKETSKPKHITSDSVRKAKSNTVKPATTHKAKLEEQGTSSSKQTKTKAVTSDSIKRDKHGKLLFSDYPHFKPNLTPKEVLQAGSFGGTYFRPIHSSVTGEDYRDVWKEFPEDWFAGLNIKRQVASSIYHNNVNTYLVKCGGSLEMWESSGWIRKQDPYGWFQWYCRFLLGRRTDDDERQVGRWERCAGPKGRWRNNLIAKCVRSGCSYDNFGVSPVVRQTLQHWGYKLTKEDFDIGAKRIKK